MIDNPGLSFSVDEFVKSLQRLDNPVASLKNKMLYSEAKDTGHFVQAELGVFRNNQDGSIWSLSAEKDGNQYIVRVDDEAIKQGEWAASVNRTGDTITLAYSETPVRKFAAAEFGFAPENAREFAKMLIEKATTDGARFTKSLLSTVAFHDRIFLQKKFAAFRQE